jgi:hypothetical protein
MTSSCFDDVGWFDDVGAQVNREVPVPLCRPVSLALRAALALGWLARAPRSKPSSAVSGKYRRVSGWDLITPIQVKTRWAQHSYPFTPCDGANRL